jgi:hypothetical protein
MQISYRALLVTMFVFLYAVPALAQRPASAPDPTPVAAATPQAASTPATKTINLNTASL